ncbi:antiterminator LoaP [Paenibacillus harenae]|uniref:Transcription termination/antitermination protein NusG n=1 Tax=Paenibacillus harenae TaxID=306543 RepID=A0ABT9U7F8_PAEHA|nr:antiterminator LoaP [Paenibacillus harenae]MDQ0115581.1 transcriptional antiterminator NusG [Paenibacillus harenae]
MSWYALSVKSGEEHVAKRWIEKHIGEESMYCMIPKRLVPERKHGIMVNVERALFPGYVFIETKMSFSTYYKLKENPYLLKFLNYLNNRDKHCHHLMNVSSRGEAAYAEEDYFKRIPADEISTVLLLLNDQDMIDYSKICIQDMGVIVQSGPLKGLERHIKKIDKHKRRAKVLLSLMGTEKLIDFGIEIISESRSGALHA